MSARTALQQGARQLLRFRRVIALYYVVNLAAAAVVAVPVAVLLRNQLGHSLESERLFANFDPAWLAETLYRFHYWPAWSTGVTLGSAALLFLIVNTFLAGGAIAVSVREDDAFFSACARYFWKLLRLMLLSLAFYAAVMWMNNGAGHAMEDAREASMAARPWILIGWARMAVVVFAVGLVNMIFDYAKILVVTGEARGAIAATRGALRFVSGNARRTLAVYWTCAAMGGLMLLAYHGISEAAGQGNLFTVALVLMARQVFMMGRMWVKLWTWWSEVGVFGSFEERWNTLAAEEGPIIAD